MSDESISRFVGQWSYLSNFCPCSVPLDGAWYPTVENAYQAAKTTDLLQREKFQHVRPGHAKRQGRKLALRPDWEAIKEHIMLELLQAKFGNEPFRSMLRRTGNRPIQEGNNWHDLYWGVCDGSCRHGPHESTGKNRLGVLLMQIREHILIV